MARKLQDSRLDGKKNKNHLRQIKALKNHLQVDIKIEK